MNDKNKVIIQFDIEWNSSVATHIDSFVLSIDLEKDHLPEGFKDEIKNLKIGDSYSKKIQAKELLGDGYSSNNVITFDAELFNHQFKNQSSPPLLYRFYPSAIAYKGLKTNEKDYTPFRLISKNAEEMIADRNHPLAKYYLTLKALKVGGCSQTGITTLNKDITRIITSKGPGMQAPFEFGQSIFFDDYPFKFTDKVDVIKSQIDDTTTKKIKKIHTKLLPKYSKILDVMADQESYLADDYESGLLVGIGKNEETLSENKRLNTFSIHDINENLPLPFEDNSFDDAICTLSICSFIDPIKVFQEIARVVANGGKFIISFTDVDNSNLTISLWGQLHPFERMQLVLEYFQKSELFSEVTTYSQREIKQNSVYTVWGTLR